MIEEAIKIARRSSFKRYMTGCVIVNARNEIVSNGWSHKGTWHRHDLYTIHAEMHAIARARYKKNELDGCTAYIVTIARKSGNYTTALPCLSCATALIAVGMEYVVVTIRDRPPKRIYLPDDLEDLKVYERPS